VPSFDDARWPRHTARLLLRPWREADSDLLWAYRRLPEVQEWLGWRVADRDGFATGMRERHLDRGFRTVVVHRADPAAGDEPEVVGPVIGDVVVMPRDGWAQSDVAARAAGAEADLGWTFDPAHGGRGYATEAVAAVVDLCFTEVGLRRVQAGCFADNVASWRLMERLGMRREEHSRRTGLHSSGRWLDGMAYGILAEEWADR